MTQTPSDQLFIGLMSGTSLDGIDAVLADFSTTSPRILAAHTFPLPTTLRSELLALCQPGLNEVERLGRADRALAIAFAAAANQILQASGVAAGAIRAIGSHGQTIRHRPNPGAEGPAFTLQIGDPNTIAELTGITTIADFRRRDIAAGGQGAPLVPAFHNAIFGAPAGRVIVNIGGMANITALPPQQSISGFDTGPGNALLDSWIDRHQSLHYDRDGTWASSGNVQPKLLERFLADPFFSAPAPKSTGREHFNLDWLDQHLSQLPQLAPADVQATLAELTAASIADAIALLPFNVAEVFACGGGAFNGDLMQRLQRRLPKSRVGDTGELGIAPEWVEAAAFAWLARATLAGLPGNEPAVTGAEGYRVLGGIFPA